MALIKVGLLSALPPGSVMEAEVGEAVYAVCNFGGELHAMNGTCPHAGGPLGQGVLAADKIVCPWHAWEFDCKTGENDFDAAVKVEKYPVRVEGDEIWLEVPEVSA